MTWQRHLAISHWQMRGAGFAPLNCKIPNTRAGDAVRDGIG